MKRTFSSAVIFLFFCILSTDDPRVAEWLKLEGISRLPCSIPCLGRAAEFSWAHQYPWGLQCKAAFQPVGSQYGLGHGIILLQGQYFAQSLAGADNFFSL